MAGAGYPVGMMIALIRSALLSVALALFANLVGCGHILKFLPKVIATVTDAQLILDEIEDYCDAFFSVKPNPQVQRGVDQALDQCRVALSVALRTTTGAENLSEEQLAEAFKDFQAAYRDLLVLVEPLGVKQSTTGNQLSVSPDQLVVPPPLALGLGET